MGNKCTGRIAVLRNEKFLVRKVVRPKLFAACLKVYLRTLIGRVRETSRGKIRTEIWGQIMDCDNTGTVGSQGKRRTFCVCVNRLMAMTMIIAIIMRTYVCVLAREKCIIMHITGCHCCPGRSISWRPPVSIRTI